MRKGHGLIWRLLLVVALGVGLIVTLSLAGCGGKKEVQTEVAQPEPEPLPPPPAPEPETPPPPPPAPDYANMLPQEYGIDDVYFDFDKYDLSTRAVEILTRDAGIMRNIKNVTWVVAGHCDERGTIEYNLALGEKRAKAVRDFLVSLDVPTTQLRVTSYGESKPFVQGHTEEAWAANRRVHFDRP